MSLSALSLSFAGSESLQREGIATTAFNPLARAGELVVIIARAGGSAVTGKLAIKLAVEHFTDAILDLPLLAEPSPEAQAVGAAVHKPRAVAMLEAGFERANEQIYAFGHKLAAGGTLSASMIAIAVSDGELAAAKVGEGDVMLERQGEQVWLFSGQESDPLSAVRQPGTQSLSAQTHSAQTHSARRDASRFDAVVLVGSHRQVPVDFLHLGIQAHDVIALHSFSRSSGSMFADARTQESSWTISVGPSAVFLDEPART